MITRTACLLATMICVMKADSLNAQARCDPCTVSLTRVAQLGTENGPGVLGGSGTVARVPHGSFFVASSHMLDEIKVFNREGQFVRRIGRTGAGPGEFRHVWLLTTDGDHVYAFDGDNNRVTQLRASDGSIVAEQPWKWPARSVAVLPKGTFVINADIRTRALAGVPLHRLDSRGEIVRSFGDTDQIYRSDVGYPGHRVIAASQDGHVWSTPRTRYEISKWTVDGEIVATFDRGREWFRPHLRTVDFSAERAPPPLVVQMREDAQGRLWVLSSVADSSWKDGLEYRRDHPDGPRYVAGNYHDYFDTIIEVLNSRTGSVIASARSDRYIVRFADDEHLVSFTESSTGVPRIEVWHATLSPTSREE